MSNGLMKEAGQTDANYFLLKKYIITTQKSKFSSVQPISYYFFYQNIMEPNVSNVAPTTGIK